MRLANILTAGAVIVAMGATAAKAEESTTMSATQKKQIEQVVHDYLVKNPTVLIEASQALQEKQQQAMQKEAKSAIAQHGPELVSGTLAVAGNPKGSVTMVEFFDYQCMHCIKMKPVIGELIRKNKNLRVVYKEFPIFGKESEAASKAALAAGMQGKYVAFQNAMFLAGKHVTEQQIMEIAKQVGLKMPKFKQDMESTAVQSMLKSNRVLAEKIHLMGTPAFIVLATPEGNFKPNGEAAFVPGAASEQTLQALINKAAG